MEIPDMGASARGFEKPCAWWQVIVEGDQLRKAVVIITIPTSPTALIRSRDRHQSERQRFVQRTLNHSWGECSPVYPPAASPYQHGIRSVDEQPEIIIDQTLVIVACPGLHAIHRR